MGTALSLPQNFSVPVFAILVVMVFIFILILIFIVVVFVAVIVVIIAAVIVVAATASAIPTSRGATRNRDVIGVKRHCTAERENPARYTNAVSDGVTGEGDQVSHESSAGAESGGAANLPEDIATLGAVG